MAALNDGEEARRRHEGAPALTGREREVLDHIARGLSNKEIATALRCAPKTVECHVTSLLRKYNVDSRLRLMLARRA
jgi:LuxR family transcriptional regulator, maltose regulon positive regulatory protein